MNLTLKLLAACAALSLAAISFSGCGGNDCATGTKESDGQCIPDTTTCGGGTTLVNGKCQLDATGCGEGASLDSTGKCVADAPTGEECGDGTMFDAGTGKCTPTSVITCGANTKNEGGQCVPDTGTCAAGTKLSDDGQCVIDAPACSTGTQLDPNSAKCVVTDQVCGANTAFDAASGTCKTADTVCAAGTTFSADTGLCLPEATCQMGDVIVEGKCVSPSQALASMATVTSMENDDPRFMGTANALTIPAMQGDKVIAKGTINAPVDLDADGTPDQDYDFYTIQGTAGQHISVDLAVIAGPSMSFALIGPDGPDNYIRISGQGAKRGASRTFLIPKDGEYSLVVAPSISVLEGDQAGPFGEDGWDYVLSVGNVAAPVATDFDPALNNVAGSFGNLSDNLHKVVNVAPGTIVDMTIENVGRNVEGFVQVWNGPAAYLGEYPAVAGETYRVVMPSMGDTFLFFDWASANGAQLDYEVSITPLPGQENLGAIPAAGTATSTAVTAASGDIRYISFTLAAGEVAEITHTNDEGTGATTGSYDIEVSGPDGSTVFTDSSFATQGATSSERAYVYAPNGGSFVITAEATGTRTNSVFTVTSKTPADAGSHMIGGQIVIAQANALAREERDFHTVTLTDVSKLTGALVGGGNETVGDLWVYDLATGQQVAALTTTTTINLNLPAGSYLFAVEANLATLPTGYTLTLDVVGPPALEIEPNNDQATATPFTDFTKGLAGTTYSISTAAQADPDYFKVTIPNAAIYKMSTTSSNFCFEQTLLNGAGDILYNAETQNPSFSIFLTPGDYYLLNSGWCSSTQATIDYEVLVTETAATASLLDAAGNDTFMTAVDGTMAMLPVTVAGGIEGAIDEDWFKLNIATASVKEFSLGALDALPAPHSGMTVQFFAADGVTEYMKSNNTVDLPVGDVFVKVSGFVADGNNSYLLRIRNQPTPPVTPAPYTAAPALAIPDDDLTGVTTTLTVATPTMPCLIAATIVEIDITHTYQGDLLIDLTSPGGTTVRLHNGTGFGADNIIGTYGIDLTSSASLDGFIGEDANGVWTMKLVDDGGGDTGTLNTWGLSFSCQ